jgi:hypothetical protein
LFVRCSRGDDTCLPSPGFSQVETSPSLAACLTTNRNMVHALLAVVNSKVLVRRVPSVPLFRQLLRVVRSWAQARKVYGAKNGFLGGFHWSCLVARVCVVVLDCTGGACVTVNRAGLHGCTTRYPIGSLGVDFLQAIQYIPMDL